MLLPLFLLATITWARQPTPCPRGCTERDRWGTGFTTYTYVHRACYVSPAQLCSLGGKWYWMAKSLGTAKSSSVSNCYKARGKDLCFTMQTYYGMTDRKGAQDRRQEQIQHEVQQDLIKLATEASGPHHEPNKLLDQVHQALKPLDFSSQIFTILSDTYQTVTETSPNLSC